MRQVHDISQGSPMWHEFRATHFGASEAAAMLGISPYKTRSQLLHEKATGIAPDVDAGTQSRFNDGHRFEALARPLAEKIIGEALSPVTISEGKLSASLDGISFDDAVIWEHKTLSNGLEQIIERGQPLPDIYIVQMEQQLMLSGATKCLFQASRWNGDTLVKEMHQWYESDPLLRDRILAGWAQFEKDLAAFVPPEIIPEVVAAPIKDLPALSVQATGMVTHSNLTEFKAAAESYIANINTKLETDQQFSDAEAVVKFCKSTEETLEVTKKAILAQTATIDEVIRTVDHIQAQLRDKRLMLDKLVKSEKDARKLAIVSKAGIEFSAYIEQLERETHPIQLAVIRPDFGGATKGLKKLSAMQEAVDNTLRDGKMEADLAALVTRAKLAWFKENAPSHNFLFHDLQQIIGKQTDDFKLLVTTRIDKHKADEAAKIERIREEERVKVEAAAKAKVEAEVHAKAVAEIKEREAAQGTPQERGRGDAQLTHHNPVDEASAIKDRGAAIGGVQGANQCEFAGVSILRLWGYIQPSDVPLSRSEKVYVVDEEGFDGCTVAVYIKEERDVI